MSTPHQCDPNLPIICCQSEAHEGFIHLSLQDIYNISLDTVWLNSGFNTNRWWETHRPLVRIGSLCHGAVTLLEATLRLRNLLWANQQNISQFHFKVIFTPIPPDRLEVQSFPRNERPPGHITGPLASAFGEINLAGKASDYRLPFTSDERLRELFAVPNATSSDLRQEETESSRNPEVPSSPDLLLQSELFRQACDRFAAAHEPLSVTDDEEEEQEDEPGHIPLGKTEKAGPSGHHQRVVSSGRYGIDDSDCSDGSSTRPVTPIPANNLSRLDTPTYINELLAKPGLSVASSKLLKILKVERVKLDSSLGFKLLKLAEELNDKADTVESASCNNMEASGLENASAESSADQTQNQESFSQILDTMKQFSNKLTNIEKAVGVGDSQTGSCKPSSKVDHHQAAPGKPVDSEMVENRQKSRVDLLSALYSAEQVHPETTEQLHLSLSVNNPTSPTLADLRAGTKDIEDAIDRAAHPEDFLTSSISSTSLISLQTNSPPDESSAIAARKSETEDAPATHTEKNEGNQENPVVQSINPLDFGKDDDDERDQPCPVCRVHTTQPAVHEPTGVEDRNGLPDSGEDEISDADSDQSSLYHGTVPIPVYRGHGPARPLPPRQEPISHPPQLPPTPSMTAGPDVPRYYTNDDDRWGQVPQQNSTPSGNVQQDGGVNHSSPYNPQYNNNGMRLNTGHTFMAPSSPWCHGANMFTSTYAAHMGTQHSPLNGDNSRCFDPAFAFDRFRAPFNRFGRSMYSTQPLYSGYDSHCPYGGMSSQHEVQGLSTVTRPRN